MRRHSPLAWVAITVLAAGCGGDKPSPRIPPSPPDNPSSGSGGGGNGTGGGGGSGGGGGGAGGAVEDASAPPAGGGPDAVATGPADGGSDGAGAAGEAGAGASGPFTVPPGLTALFDGKTLDGWMGDAKIWSVNATDMAIEGKTKNSGENIYTTQLYDDFRLIVTERALPDMDTHLGICFWGRAGGTGYNSCLDVIPPSGAIWDYGDGGMKPTGVGGANNNIKYTWHQVEILALAATGEVLVAVNGKQVTTYKKAGRPKKGPIGLQAHNGTVHEQYKDIFIEVAPKDRNFLTAKP